MADPIVYRGTEPDVDGVAAYTGGRLSADSDETQRQLDAALTQVRSYCGWHVAPVKQNHEIILDGRGGRVLELPTGLLLDLTALAEDGRELDVDVDVSWSANGLVRKRSNAYWIHKYRAITATLTHGYDTPPADWVEVVFTVVDRLSMNVGMTQSNTSAGPFSVQYFPTPSKALDDDMRAMLEPYRLAPVF
jgi:hypothetical protein